MRALLPRINLEVTKAAFIHNTRPHAVSSVTARPQSLARTAASASSLPPSGSGAIIARASLVSRSYISRGASHPKGACAEASVSCGLYLRRPSVQL